MATVRFYTRTKLNKLATVWIRFIDGSDIDLRMPTPYRIFPDYWNEDKQTLKQRILYTKVFTEETAKDLQDTFDQLRDTILRELYKLSPPASKEWLQATIDKFHTKGATTDETLTQYVTRFVEEAKSGKRLATAGNTKKHYAYGSLRVLTGFKLSFENFCTKQGRQYNFNDINIDFYNDFVQYFYARNCGANYIGKHIKSLKTIMRQAREEGLHNNTEIERRAFKAISEEVDSIYLTEAELQKLFDLDLSHNKVYSVARDVFLCGCYTAQRYSDYSRLNKSNIKEVQGSRVIELVQKKTGERCLIPIRQELETILQRYDYTLPKTHEQKINFNIKKVAAEAEITEPVDIEKNKGGLRVKETVKKCTLIKTHTARRTGCTLMYLAGIPVIDIMKISGHRTQKEFLKYIKVGKEETVISMASHPYFAGSALKVAH